MLFAAIQDFYEQAQSMVLPDRALEKAVDSFDFLQDSETFIHRLGFWMRNACARCLTD